MRKIADAIHFAKQHHHGQLYGEHPYYYHLNEVANRVISMGIIADEYLQVAWLHDIVEDTDVTYETLAEHGFNYEVIRAVKHITKEKGEKYWDYINKVKENDMALFIKKADTLCNLTHSVMENNVSRIKKYSNQLKYLYGDKR